MNKKSYGYKPTSAAIFFNFESWPFVIEIIFAWICLAIVDWQFKTCSCSILAFTPTQNMYTNKNGKNQDSTTEQQPKKLKLSKISSFANNVGSPIGGQCLIGAGRGQPNGCAPKNSACVQVVLPNNNFLHYIHQTSILLGNL